jgi:hypothetical protein
VSRVQSRNIRKLVVGLDTLCASFWHVGEVDGAIYVGNDGLGGAGFVEGCDAGGEVALNCFVVYREILVWCDN